MKILNNKVEISFHDILLFMISYMKGYDDEVENLLEEEINYDQI